MSMKTYYQMSEEEIRQEVNQGSQPLTVDQVRNRQKEYGPNELIEGEKKSLLGIFAEQFRDFLVIILMISFSGHHDERGTGDRADCESGTVFEQLEEALFSQC